MGKIKKKMKATLLNLTTLMFFITLLNIQFTSSVELSSTSNLSKINKLKSFRGECSYYDLKVQVVKINYVKKIHLIVNTLTQQFKDFDINNITFKQFKKIFKTGNYGKVAEDLAESDDYVRSYYNYFSKNQKMSIKEFTHFMGLYHLEGELLVEDNHPILSKFFKNEHEVGKRRGCKIAIAYWELVNNLLKKIYLKFQWTDSTIIKKKEILETLISTKKGHCWLKMNKECKFFDEFISKSLGFFNETSGRNKGLTVHENKMAYSTFLFKDISEKKCKAKNVNSKKMDERIQLLLKEFTGR